MSSLVVRNGSVITPAGPIMADITIEEGTITSIGETGPDSRLDFDATGLLVAPGLIDLQVNGVAGHDFSSHPDSVWPAGEWLASTGVTAYLPTVITGSDPEAAIKVMGAGPPSGYRGAIPLGIHLEGPFLSAAARGTHPEHLLVPPSVDDAPKVGTIRHGGNGDSCARDTWGDGGRGPAPRRRSRGRGGTLARQLRRGQGGGLGRGHPRHPSLQRHAPSPSPCTRSRRVSPDRARAHRRC